MKKKFILAAVEIIIFNFLAIFLVYKLWLYPRLMEISGETAVSTTQIGLWIFLSFYVVGMVGLGIHIYVTMIKPAAVAQEDLKAAAAESKKAETIRKEFVANVSHELNTPLTSISGFIETLQQGAAEDPQIRTKFIDIVAIEAARLKRLIEDLLVLSDIENPKEPIDLLEIDVQGAIENIVQTLEPIAHQKNVTIIPEYGEAVRISGSTDRFKQMLVNLIENAIKYSNDGGRVWVEAKAISGKSQITVRDEGIGIAEEHLQRLFERFYRVDKSRSQKAGGTGLGLSIVKHIAVLFNAELKVESTIGKGTIFYVIFER